MKHYAIESHLLSMKGKWIQSLLKGEGQVEVFKGKRGLLFSTITLETMIDEEVRHNQFLLSNSNERSIRTYSSGEQRKALLKYQMSQKPDFLVLDNPFDCLDVESVATLKNQLIDLAHIIPMVQIFKRHTDIMPFVSEVLVVDEESLKQSVELNQFLEQNLHQQTAFLSADIPAPLKHFKDIPEILIELKKVSVNYEGRCIVKDITWKIKRGEFWHLKGRNGSGKTTLLSMIYGDNPKAYGVDLFLFGQKKGSGESVWDLKEKMGYFTPSMTELFQSNHTVEQMVISGLVDSVGLYLKPTDRQKNLAQRWLNVLGLLDKKNDRFYRLSQVNQRLILIVRAMIKHPPLLILDEPSTGLDDYSASLMVQLIQKIAEESNTAIIYVSHRKEEGLEPKFTYELQSSKEGSLGGIMTE
ncbi:ATP-binding cassette domain-containing protein [Labilibacter marinus]|uniref:ATP-binding cassette domain-containing protein n=1 Tax=Labilibacter marinus TaxID=1477105 RepID=UPI000A9A5EFE|nr:ATP-binding cassette domain-containing protein [Labilibacter marinus]